MSTDRLFKPLKVGNANLHHRVVMAPLTRFRAYDNHVPTPCARDYYEQRASVPGTLLITEATFISSQAAGYKNVPGIWNEEQVKAWKTVTDAVHAKGSFIYLQLWALGRTADPDVLKSEGGYRVMGPSAIGMGSGQHSVGVDAVLPTAMEEDDIKCFVEDYAQAARNAMLAGFDGVEIHGANGYLIDQFWQDISNHRTDGYGGSIKNRARFGLEVTKAVIDAVGDSNKVGMRLSPWSQGQGMGMNDPVPQFSYIVQKLNELDLSYLHLVERRMPGTTPANAVYLEDNQENDVFIQAWKCMKPILLAGGFTLEKAKKITNEVYPSKNIGIVFGRYFISNPDLPFRLQYDIKLSEYDRSTFYAPWKAEGYTDYAFSEKWIANSKIAASGNKVVPAY